MSLAPGTYVGEYRLISLIGQGGMGEVYRARDEKLGREVALKILPDTFTHDTDRLARFRREAQILASLNHPNIAAIYGLEEAGDRRALVLELVEGPTLAERLAQGSGLTAQGLAIDETVRIARQICEALEAAHEQGIIHRDLKPANIKVREDGTVKVLDFGLAKLTEAQGSRLAVQDGLSQSPTITTPAMTQMGMILGTAAYMAPEQAKGRPADKRSDVWAFGCVLYEMLAGKRPFAGEDVSDTLASVLKEEPDWTALPSTVPPAIRTLVQRCLVKDRHRRVADIAAAQFVLADHAGLTTAASGPTAGGNRSARPGLAWMAAAVLLTAAIVGAAVWRFWPANPPAPGVVRFTFGTPGGEPFSSIARQHLAISPGGTQIAYLAGGRLYRRAVNELESHAIAEEAQLYMSTFSPDGQSIAFYSGSERTLKRILTMGGTPTSIGGVPSAPNGMSWGEAGIVFAVDRQGIFRVSPNGGEPEQIVRLEPGESAWGPQLLPGGASVLFTLRSDAAGETVATWDTGKIVVQSLTSGKRTVVVNGGSDARFLSSGHLVYSVSGTVFAIGFDPASQATLGDAVPVLAGVERSVVSVGATTQYSVSDTGVLVYVAGPVNASSNVRNLVLFDRNGVAQPLKLAAADYGHPRVSPDGRRLAVGIVSGQQADVWVYDLDGASAIRRLTLQGRSLYPVWSADSQRVAFQSDREGDLGIFWQRADGSGAPERLTTASKGAAHVPESWSPDGQRLLLSEVNTGSHVLLSLSMSDKSTAPFGGVRSVQPIDAVFSPDARWVAYTTTPVGGGTLSPDRGVFVQPFPATGARFQAPKVALDYHPAWARDGKELFYSPGASRPLVAVGVQTQPQVTFKSPVNLPDVSRSSMFADELRGYDTLPGGRFVGLTRPGEADSGAAGSELHVVVNWLEELKRLVPSR